MIDKNIKCEYIIFTETGDLLSLCITDGLEAFLLHEVLVGHIKILFNNEINNVEFDSYIQKRHIQIDALYGLEKTIKYKEIESYIKTKHTENINNLEIELGLKTDSDIPENERTSIVKEKYVYDFKNKKINKVNI